MEKWENSKEHMDAAASCGISSLFYSPMPASTSIGQREREKERENHTHAATNTNRMGGSIQKIEMEIEIV